MSGNKNLVAAAIVVVDARKRMHDGVKDYEICPDGHGAGQDNLAAITCCIHDSGNVTPDDVYCLVHRSGEVESSGDLLDFASCVQSIISKAKIDDSHFFHLSATLSASLRHGRKPYADDLRSPDIHFGLPRSPNVGAERLSYFCKCSFSQSPK